MRVGPAAVMDAIQAVIAAGIGTRDDFYWTLHAVLVTRHEDHAVFDEAFRLFWRSRELIEKMLAMFSPIAPDTREKEKPRAAESRVAQAMFEDSERARPHEIPEIEVDARLTVSGKEVLREKDFAQMTAAELAAARKAIAEMNLPYDLVVTRRFRPDPRGVRVDPRAMMRGALRTGGDLILPRFRSPREGASAAGRARRRFGLDEPVYAHFPAFPACAHRKAPARAYLRVRHPAHQPHPPDAPSRP